MAVSLFSAAPRPAAGQELSIQPFEAAYEIKAGILTGSLLTEVVKTDSGLVATSTIKAEKTARTLVKGNVVEHAEFSIAHDLIRPRLYSSSDKISRKPRKLDFIFDWEAGAVSGIANDQPYQYELSERLYDRVTIQYQLMLDLQRGERVSSYRLMDGKRIKDLQLNYLPSKQVKTPFGTFDAIGVKHDDTRKNRVTILWCAEELGFIPVAIEQYSKNKLLARIALSSYTK